MRVGLPRMHREAREKRDFLPGFVANLDASGADDIVLEHGYGAQMGVPATDYGASSSKARFGSFRDCLAQDVVLQIRCLPEQFFGELRPGAVLMSMMHYQTRPERVRKLAHLGVRAVSLDGLVDDNGRRLIENLSAVAWNGVEAAFRELSRNYSSFDDPARPPIRATVLGAGAVGAHAVHAASRYGDARLRDHMAAGGVMGVEVRVVDYDLTCHEDYMRSLLRSTDLLIDATQRFDPTRHVVPNAWLSEMPEHAVLLDLSVDPYDFSGDPPIVKGIEGMPQGTLDKFVFHPHDAAYDELDRRISTEHRRLALSCYSWPGLNPRACMKVYGAQLAPFLGVVLNKPVDDWDPEADSLHERALARAEIKRWLKSATA
ncbi:MAG: hypothetical protein M3343_11955 [Actinomycetota bacterium]|nr:hypothetical protein [Actinomycetota bacterium]